MNGRPPLPPGATVRRCIPNLPIGSGTSMSKSEIFRFLERTRFASYSIHPIRERKDIGKYTFRIHLIVPFLHKNTAIVKHSTSFTLIAGLDMAQLDPIPQFYETRTKFLVKENSPDCMVTVPEIYHIFYDNLVIMEDSGCNLVTLEDFITSGILKSPNLTRMIGSALGDFLAWFHGWSKKESGGIFQSPCQNTQIKKALSSGPTDYVEGILLKMNAADPLDTLQVTPEDVFLIHNILGEMENDMLSTRDFAIMGEFCPINILLELDPFQPEVLKRIVISDWDWVTTGVPGFDLGMFCANLHNFSRISEEVKEASWNVLNYFLWTYAQTADPGRLRNDLARETLGHWGIRLISLGYCMEVNDIQSARTWINEGVQYIRKSRIDDYARQSESVRALFITPDSSSPSGQPVVM